MVLSLDLLATKQNETKLEQIVKNKEIDILRKDFLSWKLHTTMVIDAKNNFAMVITEKYDFENYLSYTYKLL